MWLKRRGYRVIERNLRLGDDEADIIALDPDGSTIVLVEVKTRRRASPAPEESIGSAKRFRLARTAARLQQTRYPNRALRFDVMTIIWPEGEDPQIKHWASAFDSPF
jgi:putative endonuclease